MSTELETFDKILAYNNRPEKQKDLRIKYEITKGKKFSASYTMKQISLLNLEPEDLNNIRYSLQETFLKYYKKRHEENDSFDSYACIAQSILFTLKAIEAVRKQIRHIQF